MTLEVGEVQAWYVVMHAISLEMERQNDLWGQQNHEDLTWLAIMGEEFGETAEQCIPRGVGGCVDEDHLERELTQTVAVGMQWLMARNRRRMRVAGEGNGHRSAP